MGKPSAPGAVPDFRIPKAAKRARLETPQDLIMPWRDASPPRRMILDSDNHFEVADPAMQNAKFKFAQHVGVDFWLNLGDQYDFNSLSRFDKDPARGFHGLQEEFDSAEGYWKSVCSLAKRVEMIQGNHEFRLYKTLMANPGFFGLKALDDWHTFAQIPSKVVVHPYGTHRQVGMVWGEHGDQIRGGANPWTWAITHRMGRVIVFGHHHKMGYAARTMRNENGDVITREAYAQGHGSMRLWQSYAGTVPQWQHSFTYAEHFTVAGKTHVAVYPIHVQDGVCSFNGKVFNGNRG